MELKKNDEYIVDIIDNGFQGEGIAKINDITIFIDGALKGEKVKIVITKVTSSFAYGKMLEIIEQSEDRRNVDCDTYKQCGGCDLRHMEYSKTLLLKKKTVENCIYKALGKNAKVNDPIGMEEPLYYRNKLQYPIGIDANGKTVMGVFANRTHRIIRTIECIIQDKLSQDIANDIIEFIQKNNISGYNEETLKGTFRHLIIRVGKATNEIMVVFVLNENKFELENKLVELLTNKYKQIKTIVKNINKKNTNVILGMQNTVLYGNGYIYDILGEFKFKISPMSFYQVNPKQAEVLYNTAIKFAELSKTDTALDLYCGVGTISIFLSKYVKQVYGVEIVKEAIEDAKENAKLNNIQNVEFIVGDVEETLPKLDVLPDVVFLDPPRKGIDNTSIQNILKFKPKKIVYISCNPATLARDLKLLDNNYEIKVVQPIDLFGYTKHIECCSLLCRK